MKYAEMLRKMFQGLRMDVEDLYLLEAFQIGYLPKRAPPRELAAVLWANPSIKRYLLARHPPIGDFVESTMAAHGPAKNDDELARLSDDLVWEIADLIIYNKHPEAFEDRTDFGFHIDVVTSITPFEDKVVIDVGAGTGRVAFEAVKTARVVFAVEPVARLRQFMREKARSQGLTNFFVMDGFLHAIPLPDDFVDVLITCNSIGWDIEAEMPEVDRVVKQGGYAIHTYLEDDQAGNPLHVPLTSAWRYSSDQYKGRFGKMRMYWKRV